MEWRGSGGYLVHARDIRLPLKLFMLQRTCKGLVCWVGRWRHDPSIKLFVTKASIRIVDGVLV